ncbi:hypothetical protein [Rubritalea tangerina]|uniref:DUF2339 domain-containing protein n=1 Tax=Rubritalea tangerina TaxID=430798 RepID=A0ABW4ZDF2_9BACT
MHWWHTTLTKQNNDPQSLFDWLYVGFNWLEAAAWLAFSLVILLRFVRTRDTPWDLLYAAFLLLFALSDVAEVYQLTLGLLTLKVLIFLGILISRSMAIRQRRTLTLPPPA